MTPHQPQIKPGIPQNLISPPGLDPLTIDFPHEDSLENQSQNVRSVLERPSEASIYALRLTSVGYFAMYIWEALEVYKVCIKSQNKSDCTIEWVEVAVRRLVAFIGSEIQDISSVTAKVLRHFVLSLDSEPAFRDHPYTKTRTRPVSPETKSNYIRALKSFFFAFTRKDTSSTIICRK